MNYVRAFV